MVRNDLFNSTGKKTEIDDNGIMPKVFAFSNSPLGTTTSTLSRQEIFPQKNTFGKRLTQMQTTQYPHLLVPYCESNMLKTGNKNPIVVDEDLSFVQSSMSSPLVFDSVKMKFFFFH